MSELEKASTTQSDYVRRLHQQIVQKDSIIKLLQVQVKNLEAAGADAASLDRLTTALGEAEARLAEYEAREDADASVHRKVLALEAELENLRPAAERARRVEAALALKDAELERQRDLLRRAEVDDAELARLEGDNQRLRRETDELSRELGKLRESAARAGRGGPAPDTAELERLREQVADLEASLEVARAMASSGERQADPDHGSEAIDRDDLMLLQGVIEACQAQDDLRNQGLDSGDCLEALGEALAALCEGLGLERVPTVGERFDPRLHVLGSVHYREDAPHDTVLAEEAAGYQVRGRVVKPAEVTVAKNPWFCERCQIAAVSGAAFCHHCGGRIASRPKESLGAPDPKRGDRVRSAVEAAQAARNRGDLAAARAHLERVQEEAGDDLRLAEALAQLDEAEGRFADALARLGTKVAGRRDRRELERHRERLEAKLEILERLRKLR